ncbi:MAG: efflux RND transporter periplasmic adaptor subunit [Flavobacteriales bacterium]|nr:MAG: efflux RND transporter periplasmic adaptor subunit [Flavobacteriales bacterium]
MRNIIMLASVCAVLFSSCASKIEEKEEETNYTATSPLTIDTSFTKEYVSQIRSVRNIELRAQEKGFLERIYVDEGQAVKAGQLLFKIMPKMYEAEVMKAEAEVKAAQIELANTKLLADKNVVAQNELAMAKAKLEQAKASVALAKLHLSFTEIRAPFNGTIDRLPKKIGSLIDEGELLTTLSDNSEMFAYFNVSEPEYLNFQQAKSSHNKSVDLVLANGETLKGKGTVETIEGEFDSETGNIAFRAKFPNPNQLLRNGETGKVQMVIPLKNALIIPQKATYELQDKNYVFVIEKNGTVKSKEIKIGGELADIYMVSSGLQHGDKIVLDGVQKVKDDEKIKFTFMEPKQVLNQLQLKAE